MEVSLLATMEEAITQAVGKFVQLLPISVLGWRKASPLRAESFSQMLYLHRKKNVTC